MPPSVSLPEASNLDWNDLLSTLLRVPPEALNIDILIVDKDIHLTTTCIERIEALKQLLKSPEMLRANTAYAVSTLGMAAVSSVAAPASYPAAVALGSLQGEVFFNQLFSAEARTKIGQITWNREDIRNSVSHSVYDEDDDGLTSAQIKKYQKILRSADIASLRRAIAESNPIGLPLSCLKGNDQGLLQVEKILCMRDVDGADGTKKIVAQFDHGLLMRCLTPPSIAVPAPVQTPDDQLAAVTITLPIDHLISYLSTVFKEGFLLCLSEPSAGSASSSQPQEQTGRLIALNAIASIPLKNHITIAFDCSGSMTSTFPAFIERLIFLATALCKVANGTIRFVPFATKTHPYTEFDLHPSEEGNIKNYLKRQKAYSDAQGHTRLDGTVVEILEEIAKSLRHIYNTSFFIMTDGINNVLESGIDERLRLAMQSLESDPMPPQVCTVGIGAEYDKLKLIKLSEAAGARHYDGDIQNIQKIVDNARDMAHTRKVIRVVQDLQRFTLTVFEGQPAVARNEHLIALNRPFSTNGIVYQAIAQPAPQMPIQPAEDASVVPYLESNAPPSEDMPPPLEPAPLSDDTDIFLDSAEQQGAEETKEQGSYSSMIASGKQLFWNTASKAKRMGSYLIYGAPPSTANTAPIVPPETDEISDDEQQPKRGHTCSVM